MAIPLLQIAAAVYLVAGLAAGLGLTLPSPRALRSAPVLLLAGVLLHSLSVVVLHQSGTPPPLTDLPTAVSVMAWFGVSFSLFLLWRARLAALAVLVGPLAFLSTFYAALRLPQAGLAAAAGSGSWPHAHVMLASSGLGLLGVAGLAGILFLAEHRRLKAKRPLARRTPLPTLEALDRVNAASLALGFPLLTLGVITGMMWLWTERGSAFSGSPHELWNLAAWAVYAGLAAARFLAGQGSRQAAASAVGGFALLFFAAIGLRLFP
jgi:ABC-type transport system involved in cytochrome c biogenesis permease subunit